MKAVHGLGYVSVFDNNKVYVYTEDEFLTDCYFFDPTIDEETWAKNNQPEPEVYKPIMWTDEAWTDEAWTDEAWTEQDWLEWRREREGILIYDAGYSECDAVVYAKTLEALERFRVRIGT